MKFSGHESFTCRYAWLPKAYALLMENPDEWGDEEAAMVRLGVGKNMVRSLRFWTEAMGIAEHRSASFPSLTPFAHALLGERGLDPYLEDVRTLWLLHWKISTRFDDPLFAWDYLLNKWPYPELTRSEALAAFVRESQRLNYSHSQVTLGQHLDVFLHTYVPRRGPRGMFEDSLDCPLVELELLQVSGARRMDKTGRLEPVYVHRLESKPEITDALFDFCLDDYWNRRHPGEATLTYRDVAVAPGGIGQVFRLPEEDVRARLDGYVGRPGTRPFNYQPSAVQGLLSRRRAQTSDLLELVYRGVPAHA